MSNKDYIDVEDNELNKEKKSWWNNRKNDFKKLINNTKNSFDNMIKNNNIQSAFNDKTFEFRIENPEYVMFTGDRIYGILDDSETYILFRDTKDIRDKVKKDTLLSQVNTFNRYIVSEIDENIIHYPVVVKDENITIECIRVLIKKR